VGLNVGTGKTLAVGGTLTVTGSASVAFAAGTVSAPSITANGDTNTGIFFPAADTIAFTEGGVESFRVNSSGNMGIGTTSPANYANYRNLAISGTTGGNIDMLSGSTKVGNLFNDGTNFYAYNAIAGSLVFGTNNTERARIDSSGNLGIGTTSPVGKLQVTGSLASFILNTSGTEFYNNYAGQVKIYTSNAAGFLSFGSGGRDNDVVLSTTGNLGIGTSSPTSGFRLDVQATTARQRIESTTGTNEVQQRLINSGGTFFLSLDNNTGSGFGAAYSAVLWHSGNYPMLFATNNTERARIAADGQFSASTSLAGSNLVSFTNSSATGYGISVSVNNDSSGTYRYFEGFSSSAAAQKIAIYTNGDVKNTNGVFAAFSDAKLKKDIVDAGSQWDDIKSLRVRKYRLKDDASKALQIGLIAQEVERVSPGLVNESQDETRDEDGNIVLTGEVTKGVKYSILYMKAVKALQEAMARIEQLEAKFAALESK
jgi:hypothetical protein